MPGKFNPIARKNSRETGFSLIEAMVALMIISIGLLGLALLQVKSLKFNTDAYLRTQSTLLANDILERIRANPAGDYTQAVDITGTKQDCSTGCTAANLAKADLYEWITDATGSLPNSSVTMTKTGTLPIMTNSGTLTGGDVVYTVLISWTEQNAAVTQRWVLEV